MMDTNLILSLGSSILLLFFVAWKVAEPILFGADEEAGDRIDGRVQREKQADEDELFEDLLGGKISQESYDAIRERE